MQVVVKTPPIKIEGDIPQDLLAFVKKRYPHATVEEDDDEAYVAIMETDWYKNIVKERTPQKTLKLFRYRDNLTQAALAKKLGIPAQHVSGMETGHRTISPRMARKLGEIFGTKYQNFL
ncbi:helix-turn-helix transcriptional regulator [Treponema socranskii]|uniref:helix-turn-helix transcriptional regulator n=1 Tax=Treponema socranskii TaxID=53419 RepID=UPI003D6FB652